uniref:Uncharacterized protein n=1 Tax=Otus sunia TaxID=257818 RepID=A0A8C8AGZ9_9STRI
GAAPVAPGAGRGAGRFPCPALGSDVSAAEARKISTRSCRRTRCLSTSPKARWQRRRICCKRLGRMTRQRSVR